jgi:2-polyprenyl-6-methoxyphenol hydroxylase-like FAD-dependent oxidoreductase
MNIMVSLSKTSRQSGSNNRSHAVVIGGSMAGMLAARVLSEHFDQVTVIERDRFPEGPASRPGVPQARHLHALLARGLNILGTLFPGLSDELIAAGAVEVEVGSDFAWLNPAGWGINFNSGIKALSFSRDLLDWAVRRRVSAIPNIRLLENCETKELIMNERRDAVSGVLFRHRDLSDGAPGKEDWLAADLVVDAGGRASKMPQWLSEAGYEPPAETVINAHLGYASRLYKIPADFHAGWKGAFVQAAPPEHIRGGIMFAIEGDRWIVTLVGGDRDYPPTDEEGFLAFARSLRHPLIYETIKNAEPLTTITGYRGTENRRRHYEQLKRWPESLIVVGDGACAFNPVYGQGMTTAAIGAEWLDKCLRKQPGDHNGLARRFQRGLAKLNADPWMLSTGEDYRYRNAQGGTPNLMNRFMHRYVDRVLLLSTRDAKVRQRFLEVQGMLKPPTELFKPGVVARVIWSVIGGAFRQAKDEGRKMAEVEVAPRLRERTSPSKF